MISVNQVKHFYVVDKVVATTPAKKGELKVQDLPDNKVYFQYMGEGGLITSDVICKDQVIYATKKTAASEATKLKQAVLRLNPGINGGNPLANEDYIVDIIVSNYIAMADESTLVKFGAVHATPNMTKSDFYVQLAKSFARNFSRDINKFFKIYVTKEAENDNMGKNSSTWEEVTVHSKHTTGYTGVIISEQSLESDYVRGEFPVYTVNFNVCPKEVFAYGGEFQHFVTEGTTGCVAIKDKVAAGADDPVSIGNGYKVADLEYFCMGERGDQYRQMGYPRTIRTKYMVDPAVSYDMVDIAFYFVGRGVNSQKSEKNIVLAFPDAAEVTKLESALTGITLESKPKP